MPQRPPQIRLDYLDGLRGIAAVYVVVYHVYLVLARHRQWEKLPLSLQNMFEWTHFGHISVGVFIVLSGYCLTLPVVSSSKTTLSGGLGGFAFRRARRLLPPYYAALALSLLLIGIGYVLQSKGHRSTADLAANVAPLSLLSHIFLVHNFSRSTAYTIDSPLWSVATEAQIYVFFPLLLLPLWRRGGIGLTILAAFSIGLAPHILLHGALDQACPWYLGLFALGMAGAILSFSDQPKLIKLRVVLPWFYFAALSGIVVVLMYRYMPGLDRYLWLLDAAVGCGTVCLLVFCTSALTSTALHPQPFVLKVLGSRAAVFLGGFSYSIYLIHDPILHIAHFMMVRMRFQPALELSLILCVVVPVVICLAYGFHIAFERPFMTKPGAKRGVTPGAEKQR